MIEMNGWSSTISLLKQGLDASSERVKGIAQRVANARTGNVGSFTQALGTAAGQDGPEQVDLETEMVALADAQLRYDATTRLLQKVYAQVRASVRER